MTRDQWRKELSKFDYSDHACYKFIVAYAEGKDVGFAYSERSFPEGFSPNFDSDPECYMIFESQKRYPHRFI